MDVVDAEGEWWEGPNGEQPVRVVGIGVGPRGPVDTLVIEDRNDAGNYLTGYRIIDHSAHWYGRFKEFTAAPWKLKADDDDEDEIFLSQKQIGAGVAGAADMIARIEGEDRVFLYADGGVRVDGDVYMLSAEATSRVFATARDAHFRTPPAEPLSGAYFQMGSLVCPAFVCEELESVWRANVVRREAIAVTRMRMPSAAPL